MLNTSQQSGSRQIPPGESIQVVGVVGHLDKCNVVEGTRLSVENLLRM